MEIKKAFEVLGVNDIIDVIDMIHKAKIGPHKRHKYLKIENGKYIYDISKMSAKDHKKAAEYHFNQNYKLNNQTKGDTTPLKREIAKERDYHSTLSKQHEQLAEEKNENEQVEDWGSNDDNPNNPNSTAGKKAREEKLKKQRSEAGQKKHQEASSNINGTFENAKKLMDKLDDEFDAAIDSGDNKLKEEIRKKKKDLEAKFPDRDFYADIKAKGKAFAEETKKEYDKKYGHVDHKRRVESAKKKDDHDDDIDPAGGRGLHSHE